MKTVTLGKSDLVVGEIAYGCWRFDDQDLSASQAKIETAVDLGMNLIDTADVYGYGTPEGFGSAEAILGRVLKASPDLKKQVVLATKGGVDIPTPYNATKDYLIKACEASLSRLGVDTIDLYQVHRPDFLASAEETAEALNFLRETGKIRYAGVSNYSVAQSRALQAYLDRPLVSQQPELSAWQLDPFFDGVVEYCQETSAACLCWSPLGGGRLATGKPVEGDDIERLSALMALFDALAEKYNVSRTQIGLAFLLQMPGNVLPIIGTQNQNRIKEAAAAAHVSLTRREWYQIFEARMGQPMP